MTIFDNCTTYILNNGNVLICYDNGCRLRKSLECSASTSFYQVEQQNFGRIYWRNKALDYLGLTADDIVFRCRGIIAFKD